MGSNLENATDTSKKRNIIFSFVSLDRSEGGIYLHRTFTFTKNIRLFLKANMANNFSSKIKMGEYSTAESSREVSPVIKKRRHKSLNIKNVRIKYSHEEQTATFTEMLAVIFFSLLVPGFGIAFYWKFTTEKPELSRKALSFSCIPIIFIAICAAITGIILNL